MPVAELIKVLYLTIPRVLGVIRSYHSYQLDHNWIININYSISHFPLHILHFQQPMKVIPLCVTTKLTHWNLSAFCKFSCVTWFHIRCLASSISNDSNCMREGIQTYRLMWRSDVDIHTGYIQETYSLMSGWCYVQLEIYLLILTECFRNWKEI